MFININSIYFRNNITPSSSRLTISKNNLNNSIAESVKNRKRPNKRKNYHKNFREIPIKDIIIGCNNRGAPDTLCLVPEENNPNFVKEYTKKAREYFYCNGCGTKQKVVAGKMIGNIFYAPENHLEICFPILRATAENRLRNNKDKAPKKHMRKKNAAASKTVQNDYSLIEMQQQESEEDFIEAQINQSPIEIITIDDERDEETLIDDKNFKEECIITKSEPGYSETITFDLFEIDTEIPELPDEEDETEDPLLKRLKLQNEYLAKLVQLNQSQNLSTVTSSNVTYFHEFNHPSTNWLKKACKKLKLIYHQNAYQFWANIDVIYITETTKPNQILEMDNGKFRIFWRNKFFKFNDQF
uniref:Uncharacterized protein n=1 Tax=Panagrolaimus sp. PS1159 TaxID=55785 RepID=A0AC35FF89_9BILA